MRCPLYMAWISTTSFEDQVKVLTHTHITHVRPYIKQGGHWGDSGYARAKLVSIDRLVVNGLQYTRFYN